MRWGILILAAWISLWTQGAEPKAKPYRLPAVDLKQDVIWGASTVGNGYELFFGGQDQRSEDGVGHTRLFFNGRPEVVDSMKHRTELAERFRQLAALQKENLARARSFYFDGLGSTGDDRIFLMANAARQRDLLKRVEALQNELKSGQAKTLINSQAVEKFLIEYIQTTLGAAKVQFSNMDTAITPDLLKGMHDSQIGLDFAADLLGWEPPPRALTSMVYSPKAGEFVLFGGDHLDYLTNDTWSFSPKRGWRLRRPESAPQPRANHTLRDNGDGTITLTGGYTYANNTDYMGGQYRDIDDGEWTYNTAANTWSHPTLQGISPYSRTYRTGPFHPDYFLDAPKPDPAGFKKFLAEIPANTWVKSNPPRLPQMNRDWGTAVMAPDRDLILRYAGGHSAHGGTDVLHYHLSTNRWELTHPVEFPLGQLYSNTSYPDGFNFNKRPWITGHSYQSYVYDEQSQKMLFLGRPGHMYFYDPAMGDWAGRTGKPAELSYDSCYYTLTTTATPRGVFCWTRDGLLFVYDPAKTMWNKVELKGEKLAGSVVDNSTLTYEPKSQRLYFFRKPYGDKAAYDGKVQSVDLQSGTVTTHVPENAGAAAAVPYLCQIRCHPPTGLLVVGGTLPPDESGLRRTPAYDPVKNQWVSLKIGGDDPSGKSGRNVSLGLMWDGHRKLFWAVDAKSQVYVMRVEVVGAEVRPME